MIDGNFKKITWKEARSYLNHTGVLADCKIITALNLDDIFSGQEISKRYTFDNVVFSSQIDLSDSIFQKRLNFINCVFCGPVDLSDSIFRGNIQFIDCIFKRRIAAAGAEFTGDVEFKNCFILTDVDDDFVWPNRPFYFARARINGDLRLTDFTIRGELCLSGIKVDGKTVFSGISIENHRKPNNEASEEDLVSHLVNSRAAHTDAGNKYASEKDLVDPSQDVGWLNLRNSTLSGGLKIEASGKDGFDRRISKISDRLNLSYATVGGPVHFQELEVFGSVLLTATKLRGLTVFDLCQISKDLDLSVHTPARIRLRGITVAERLMIISSKIEGGLRIEEAPEHPERVPACTFGAVWISGSTIKSGLRLYGVKIFGLGWTSPALQINQSEIRGGLKFIYQQRGLEKRRIEPTAILGRVKLSELKISGDLEMSGLVTDDIIDLTHTRIDGELRITPVENLGADSQYLCAHARGVGAVGLTVTKDMNLTGLNLEQNDGILEKDVNLAKNEKPFHGALIASQITVEGTAVLAPEDGKKTDFHLKAPGGISLTNGRIDHLVISGWHMKYNNQEFKNDVKQKRKPTKEVDLAGAQINVLEINADAKEHYERYPRPVRLSDTVVSAWRVYEDKEDGRMLAKHFIELFEGLYPYSQTAYMQAESFLRNSGHDDEATKIYVEMKRAAFKQSSESARMNYEKPGSKLYNELLRVTGYVEKTIKTRFGLMVGIIGILISLILHVIAWLFQFFLKPIGWALQIAFRKPVHIIFDKFLSFGTNPMPLMFVIAVLYAFSVFFVFRDPQNIQPSLEARAATIKTPAPNETPDPENWGPERAAAVALRYHIPLITTYAEDDWEAKSDGPLVLSLPEQMCGAWKNFNASEYLDIIKEELGKAWKAYAIEPVSAILNIASSDRDEAEQSSLDKSTDKTLCSFKTEYLSAQGWATTMSILNYIMWPLLLTFLLRTLLRLERH